jgi:hypothetical protein
MYVFNNPLGLGLWRCLGIGRSDGLALRRWLAGYLFFEFLALGDRSMSERPIVRYFIVATALAGAASALANETQTYTYDDLGRLVEVAYSGTINAGNKHAMCYDSTDNRTRYRSDPAGAGVTCPEPVPVPTSTPTPPPPPPPNNPPIANVDVVNVPACASALADLVVNDTDPDGNAISIVSVGTTSVADVAIYDLRKIIVTGYWPNTHGWITYTITDGHGGSATGSVHIIVGGGGACQ